MHTFSRVSFRKHSLAKVNWFYTLMLLLGIIGTLMNFVTFISGGSEYTQECDPIKNGTFFT